MGDPEAQLVARAEQRLGKVLRGKWTLDTLIGIGGMAAVYAATHRNGKRAAIKILQPEAALVSDIKERFLREGYLANRVKHPGALSILDDDVDEDGTVFLVMELLHGETLEERWQRNGHLPWQEMVPVAYQTLDVLAAAHERSIVHRDIKPGNIFIDPDKGVVILDFGIARLHSRELTKSGTGFDTALGTPGFIPPEQARGRSDLVDARSDLWGLGATMFAVLSGRHVHEAETANEQLMLAMTTPPMSLADAAREIPAPVATVVDKALQYEKDARYQDAAAMKAALADAYEELLGEPITGAPRLSVMIGKATRSVQPDAPTVSADTTDRDTTARPVSEGSATGAGSRSRSLYLLVAGLVVVPFAIWLVLRGTASGEAEPAPAESATSSSLATPQPTTATAPEEPTATATAEPPAPSATVSAEPVATARLPKARPAAPRPAASSKPVGEKPAPSAPSVDIFGRRH
jgi:eukaryotic-like serine/threonine-protein kinase